VLENHSCEKLKALDFKACVVLILGEELLPEVFKHPYKTATFFSSLETLVNGLSLPLLEMGK
jgi:hypothetical protein